MGQDSQRPKLTPQFCYSIDTLRSFLRLSRSLDDTISQRLNALATPAQRGFDPSSTSESFRPIAVPGSARPLTPSACASFKEQVLFPTWRTRTEVLDYCEAIAREPEPSEPLTTYQPSREDEERKRHLQRMYNDDSDSSRVVDERLDPYSGRSYPRESKRDALASMVRQERMVEEVVRLRTWDVVRLRCADDATTWQQAWQSTMKS